MLKILMLHSVVIYPKYSYNPFQNIPKYKIFNKKQKKNSYGLNLDFQMTGESIEQDKKKKLEAEKIFFQGPPSTSELIIPTISILTVIGLIPFVATMSRQFWVRYTITNRRISVDTGFQGKNRVEIVYRDIKKISYLARFAGLTADVVIILKDNTRLELRSLPEWKKNVEYIEKKIKNEQ